MTRIFKKRQLLPLPVWKIFLIFLLSSLLLYNWTASVHRKRCSAIQLTRRFLINPGGGVRGSTFVQCNARIAVHSVAISEFRLRLSTDTVRNIYLFICGTFAHFSIFLRFNLQSVLSTYIALMKYRFTVPIWRRTGILRRASRHCSRPPMNWAF